MSPYQASRAGLQGLGPDICADTHFAPPMLWATSARGSFTTFLFKTFGNKHAELFQVAHDAIWCFMWQKHQELMLAMVRQAQTS